MTVFEKTADKVARAVRKHYVIFLLVLAVVLIVFQAFQPFSRRSVVFNQNFIEEVRREFGWPDASGILKSAISNYSGRLNHFFNVSKKAEIDVSSIDTAFSHIWRHIPYFAIVYPTELYYYFRLPEQNFAGNLRFTDIEDGNLYFAFFNNDDSADFAGQEDFKVFNSENGLKTKLLSDNRVKLTHEGKSVIFELPDIKFERPQNLRLLPEEEFIAKILDESGTLLFLLFNQKTGSFYYVLDEESPVTDIFTKISEKIYTGDRTQYAYYQDSEWGRKILIGVGTDNIWDNNYLDGPFDQVPPDLEIREKLYRAYPYTQYLNGLDPNGNFIDWGGTRVAISPYTDYSYPDTTILEENLARCEEENEGSDPSTLWSCLVFEPKRDFHKTLPEFFYPDGRKK